MKRNLSKKDNICKVNTKSGRCAKTGNVDAHKCEKAPSGRCQMKKTLNKKKALNPTHKPESNPRPTPCSIQTECKQLIDKFRRQNRNNNKKEIIKKLEGESLLIKSIYLREYSSSQSTIFEKIIMNDLKLDEPIDEISGDASKKGNNYEIKTSIHDKKSKFNWLQIRPDHKIDFYILIGLNVYECEMGRVYNYKVPATELYTLIHEYGGYAHGTCKIHGKITSDNFIGKNCEYALRVNPNSTGKKNIELMKKLNKFITPYEDKYY